MARQIDQRRVALAVSYPAGLEDEIVRGAIDYVAHSRHWRFVGRGHRPFLPFDEIDLQAIDGLIGLIVPEWVESIQRAGICAVNASTRDEHLPLPRVGNDDVAIGRMGAEHLLGLGFGHFGFVVVADVWYSERRLAGFRQRIEADAGRVCHVIWRARDGSDDPQEAIRAQLETLPKPIAIMAVNDSTALLVAEAAAELGLRIPEDLALLGVDNDAWASALSPVGLSSVAIDARRIGYRGAAMLDELMDGQQPAPAQWIQPVGVVQRRSTEIALAADPLVVDALRYIRDECGHGICVEDVLDALDVSRRTLENRMKRAIGQTPQVAIYNAQIEQAKKLLISTEANLGEIGRRCGFERQERFSLVFKRHVGMTPGQFRQGHITSLPSVRGRADQSV